MTSVARLMPSISALAAAVEVVELALGDAVVDVDGGEQQLALLGASRRADGRRWWSPRRRRRCSWRSCCRSAGCLRACVLDGGEEDRLFLGLGLAVEDGRVLLGVAAEVDEQRGVAAVVEDQVGRAAVGPLRRCGACSPSIPRASRPSWRRRACPRRRWRRRRGPASRRCCSSPSESRRRGPAASR